MEWLQTLLDSSTTPALTAFLLGLLTAISPCPLATNIAAIGFISKDIENRRRIFRNGLLYTLGRVVSYTVLGVGCRVDFGIERKVKPVRYPEVYREIRRTHPWAGFGMYRFVHVVRQQTQNALFRFQR